MPNFGDLSVNQTEGEQAEIKRQAKGSRLMEDELAGDFRSVSKFLLDDILYSTVDFELPNIPENIIQWLNNIAWPNHNRLRDRIEEMFRDMVSWQPPNMDPADPRVDGIRKARAAKEVNRMWGKFWHWWDKKCTKAKDNGQLNPMSRAQLASIKMVFHVFIKEMGFEKPVVKFWARCHCLHCEMNRNVLLPLNYQPVFETKSDEPFTAEDVKEEKRLFCEICGTESGIVLWYEKHEILDTSHKQQDWFAIAQDLKERIDSLYAEAADLEEIKPLERNLNWIEHIYLRYDADQLLWGQYEDIDERYV
jgi:hypothetical protein